MSAIETFVYVMRKLSSGVAQIDQTLAAVQALDTQESAVAIATATGAEVDDVSNLLGKWDEALIARRQRILLSGTLFVWQVKVITNGELPRLADFDLSPSARMQFSEDDAWHVARRLSEENDLCPIQEIHFDTTPSPKKELPR